MHERRHSNYFYYSYFEDFDAAVRLLLMMTVIMVMMKVRVAVGSLIRLEQRLNQINLVAKATQQRSATLLELTSDDELSDRDTNAVEHMSSSGLLQQEHHWQLCCC